MVEHVVVNNVEVVDVVEATDSVMDELAYTIEESETLGRHLVAQKNLERGELILWEKPIGLLEKIEWIFSFAIVFLFLWC